MDISHSVKMVLWVALGGRATLVGAVVGAILVNSAENFLSEAWPTGWSYIMGAAFLVTVLFLPKGLVGWLQSLSKERLREKWEAFASTRAARRMSTEGARDAA
jgi:urea transport system permease protein